MYHRSQRRMSIIASLTIALLIAASSLLLTERAALAQDHGPFFEPVRLIEITLVSNPTTHDNQLLYLPWIQRDIDDTGSNGLQSSQIAQKRPTLYIPRVMGGSSSFDGSRPESSHPAPDETLSSNSSAIDIIYVSSNSSGNVGGVSFRDEDILAYDFGTNTWSLFFDGSDVGLEAGGQEVDAFHIDTDGSILLSLGADGTVANVGTVDDHDIVRFIPTSTGQNTAGSYELYFDGEDVGLSTTGEDIDALGLAPDGRLVISTRGASFNVPGASGTDEDLIIFTPTSLGADTSGLWAMYFDGSDVALDTDNNEDTAGVAIAANGDIHLSVRGAFSVAGLSGDSADIFTCALGSTGANTSCNFSLFWDGSANGFDGELLNGFSLEAPAEQSNSPPVAQNDSASTSAETVVTINVVANDSDPDGNLDATTANTSCGGCALPTDGTLVNSGNGSFDYTPDPSFTGTDTFVYQVCDTEPLCDTATVSVTVTVADIPPVANNDSANTDEDNPVPIDVADNDTDPNGDLDPTTTNTGCATCAGTSNGLLINNGDGTFDYTPNEHFNGSDSFVYEICDDLGACDTATVDISITPVADPPAAIDDSANTVEGAGVTIDVADNDTDPDGNLNPASANSACDNGSFGCNGAGNGGLTDNGDGTITYTPDPGFTGSDTFVYEICDTDPLCDTAAVTITVGTSAPTTLEVRIAASADDAEEELGSGRVRLGSSDLEMVMASSEQIIGLRFNGIMIPKGANISNAYIQFTADETNAEATTLSIRGEKAANAQPFANTDFDISTRPPTDAAVTWIPPTWDIVGAAGADQKTPNIAPILQEIINHSQWTGGNSVVIIITGTGKRVAESYTGDPAGAALLHVEYALTGNHFPGVTINTPAHGSTFSEGNGISFTGTASDSEDGDLTTNLVWESNLHGAIGSGGSFSRTDLSVGVHTITATVMDTGGLTTYDTVSIVVLPDVPVLVGAGDIAIVGVQDEATAQLLDNIPGTVFTVGDNVYQDGTEAEFSAYYDPTWGRHKGRTRPAAGNHDYHTPGASGYFNYFGAAAGDPDKGYYSYDIGEWHIIVLNSEIDHDVGSMQEQWLRAELAANPNMCTLAYWHRPRFSSGTFHGDNTGVQTFWDALYEYGADVVLGGHEHLYERFALQNPNGVADPVHGIREFIVGTGGAQLSGVDVPAPNSEVINTVSHGVLKLTLHPTSYDWEFIPVAGQTFTDSGSAPCVTPPSNRAPVAIDDDANTAINTVLTINVAANDNDLDGNLNPASANSTCTHGSSGCNGVSNGTLTDNNNGTITYVPDPGFTGSDSFVYEICDTELLCDTATVTVTVSESAAAVLEVRIAASADDAEEELGSGNVRLGSSDLEMVMEASEQIVGLRFNEINIPQGATISKAWIQFQADETHSESTNLTIQGEAVDNAQPLTNVAFNISSRTKTAGVPWSPPAWTTKGEAGLAQQTTDITAIIQEIINRSQWTSGNSVVIIISGTGKRVAESYTGDPTGAALLHIEYAASGN